MKPIFTPKERIAMNVVFLEKIVNFCLEHNLSSPELDGSSGIGGINTSGTVTRWCRIKAGDELWTELKSELLSDKLYYQQHKTYPTLDGEIRMRGDRAGNTNSRVGVNYAYEEKNDWQPYTAYAGCIDLSLDNTRGFIWNKEWHDRIVELLKKICVNVEM